MKKCKDVIARMRRVAKIKNIQKNIETGDNNEYNRGIYNGLELALSILTKRMPDYRE